MRHPVRLRRSLLVVAVATLVLSIVGLPVERALQAGPPTPSPFPIRWELDFNAGDLRLFVDPADGSTWWYFTYQVTNKTERDRVWAPDLVLFTDAGEIMDAGNDVPTRVTEAIRTLLGNDLLETQSEIIGDLLRGPEHARDGLAVWPATNVSVNEMSLFVGGVSGETVRVLHPRTGQQYILRKTMQRDYIIRGDAVARGDTPVESVGQRWVMR
jgi:hypothetical protein